MSFREHYRARSRVLAFAAALALGSALSRPRPPPRSVDGLCALLGAAVSAKVRPADVVWEEPRGFFVEALLGRRILFLAEAGPSGARDVFRARVRVSREGHPFGVGGLVNLTRTPLGDDSALEIRGRSAVFATVAGGRVQGVTLLDLDGPRSAEKPRSLPARAVSLASNLLRTGSLGGLGETDVVWDAPPGAAKVALVPPRLRIETEDPRGELDLDLPSGTAQSSADLAAESAVQIARHDQSSRSARPWLADLLRPALAAPPGSWLLGARASALALFGRVVSPLRRLSAENRPRVAPSPASSTDERRFPPPDLFPEWELPREGEGHWVAASAASSAIPRGTPPSFYTTVDRPDPARPEQEVFLVAMDFSMLELGLEGGYEEPRPLAGPPGTGHVPRSGPEALRVVAAFDGGAGEHPGRYGVRVRGRDLLPAVPQAATVVVTEDGDVGLGPLPDMPEALANVVSLRQGQGLPGRAAETASTERSALCRLPGGHLVYAWGKDVTVSSLGRALSRLRCTDSILLGAGRGRTGFAFLRLDARDPGRASAVVASPAMTIDPRKFLTGSEGDIFYVRTRQPSPQRPRGALWKVSEGTQPEPPGIPSIFETKKNLGELDVRITSFEAGRVGWVLRAGTDEPSMPGARPKKVGVGPDLEKSVVATVGLGHTTEALRYGLAFQGEPSLPLRQTYATLVLPSSGAPRIVAPGERPGLRPDEDAVQLPLLADDGQVDGRGVDRGSLRLRGAACVTPSGRMLVATARHDSSEPLGSALLEAGCTRVVGLDRGSRHPALLQRTGQGEPADPAYTGSFLFAVTRPMAPHTFRLTGSR